MSDHSEPRSSCPLGIVLDLVGDRWTLLIIRDLMFKGFHEYREFLASGEGIASNILSSRLKKLGGGGFIDSVPHPSNRTKKLYFLTGRGKSLMPLLIEMAVWGSENCEGSRVPPEILEPMKSKPKALIKATLKRMAQWDSEHLPNP